MSVHRATYKVAAVVAVAALLSQGCTKDSSDDSVEESSLAFSFRVADSAEDATLTVRARVTEMNGEVALPIRLVDGDALVLVGEAGEATLDATDTAGEYEGVFTAPVRADRWQYRIDLQRAGGRTPAATLDLRTRTTDFTLAYDDAASALRLAWGWSDGLSPGPAWRPARLSARIETVECVYDDGRTVVVSDGSGATLGIASRGDGTNDASISMSSLPSVFPEVLAPGSCELDVRLRSEWSTLLDDEARPLVVVDERFANERLPEARKATQVVTLLSESRRVTVRVNDR